MVLLDGVLDPDLDFISLRAQRGEMRAKLGSARVASSVPVTTAVSSWGAAMIASSVCHCSSPASAVGKHIGIAGPARRRAWRVQLPLRACLVVRDRVSIESMSW